VRALALALCISITGCAFAVKHPAVTIGGVAGVIGLGSCELATDFDSHGTCAIIGGAAALALGGIVALAVLLGGEGHTVLVEDPPPPLEREKPTPAPAPAPAPPSAPPPPAPPPP
jgi:hypothetical protein